MESCDMCAKALTNPILKSGEYSYPVVICTNTYHTHSDVELRLCRRCRDKLIRFIQFEHARNRKGGDKE